MNVLNTSKSYYLPFLEEKVVDLIVDRINEDNNMVRFHRGQVWILLGHKIVSKICRRKNMKIPKIMILTKLRVSWRNFIAQPCVKIKISMLRRAPIRAQSRKRKRVNIKAEDNL